MTVSRHDDEITVACVLRSGGVYTAEWVAKLRRGVAKHLSVPHRFVCLSDIDVPCERIALQDGWPGWWSKISLWNPESGLTGRTIYLDLDTLIVGSLDAMAAHPHRFTMAHEFYRPHLFCSTAMAWEGDFSVIWREMKDNAKTIMENYRWGGRVQKVENRIGDQAFIEDVLQGSGVEIETFRALFGERSVASYKVHAREKCPDDAAVVCFHGQPKMPDARGWVEKVWSEA